LLGVSEVSSDIRDVIAASKEGNQQAQFTLELFVKRVADYIVQYQNDLDNKVDALVFTAGIGENGQEIRQMVLQCVKTMNLSYSQENNTKSYDDYLLISDQNSAVAVLAIRTNEELMICEDTYNLIS
jgi:acetate kinase